MFKGHKDNVDCICYQTSDSFISGSQDGQIAYWKINSKHPLNRIEKAHGVDSFGNPRWITCLYSLKMSNIFASGSYNGEVYIWSIGQDEKITKIQTIQVLGIVISISLSQKGIFIATSREHKFGRWISIRGNRNKITYFEFGLEDKS